MQPAISTKLIACFTAPSVCNAGNHPSRALGAWRGPAPNPLIHTPSSTPPHTHHPQAENSLYLQWKLRLDALIEFLSLTLWGKNERNKNISARTSVQGSCREEVPQWVWEPSRWLISTWWWVSGSRRRSLQVVSGLVLWLSGGEVVLQEGLDVFESGPLVWIFLPAEPHHFVQRLRAALRTRHPVAPLHLLQHLSVHHAWKTVDTESVCATTHCSAARLSQTGCEGCVITADTSLGTHRGWERRGQRGQTVWCYVRGQEV